MPTNAQFSAKIVRRLAVISQFTVSEFKQGNTVQLIVITQKHHDFLLLFILFWVKRLWACQKSKLILLVFRGNTFFFTGNNYEQMNLLYYIPTCIHNLGDARVL